MNRSVFGTQDVLKLELKSSEFKRVSSLLYDYCGIALHEGKEALVRARLLKRIRLLGMGSFGEYLDYVDREASGGEFLSLVDVLTTNKTSFFRERDHFEFLRTRVIPAAGSRQVKWWTAGCSSGEEPISCAITWCEENGTKNGLLKILATDISQPMLQVAKSGRYLEDRFREIPSFIVKKYFSRCAEMEDTLILNPSVRSMIRYGRLNLKETWPMKGLFQVIMCRNVMIYFDQPTQSELITRFSRLLEPGGYLFLGHSENLTGRHPNLKNVSPSVYQKS